MKLTEHFVQSLIYSQRSQTAKLCIPNFYFGDGESDLLLITKAGLIWEFEVKLTAADFRSEMKCIAWRPSAPGQHVFQDRHECRRESISNSKVRKHRRLRERDLWTNRTKKTGIAIPNYYTFVAPRGVVDPAELPDYAGLLEICATQRTNRGETVPHLDHWLTTTKEAPRLHREKLGNEILLKMGFGLMLRYFRERTKIADLTKQLAQLKTTV